MFWSEINLAAFENPIRADFAEVFQAYPAIAAAIRERPYGMATASHLANRIRLFGEGRHTLDSDRLDDEFEASINALSACGAADSQTCFAPGLDGFESEPFLLTSVSSADSQTADQLERAKALIGQTGYAYVCNRLRDIAVIALERQYFPNTNQSYTIQSVMQTLYLDIYEHPILTAESLVHEHAHMTFNNYAKCKKLSFPPEPRYYSPWKECNRPLFNFLHSLIAFSEVITFIEEISKMRFDEAGRSYIEMKLRFELRNIKSVRSAAVNALEVTPDSEIASLIERALRRLDGLA